RPAAPPRGRRRPGGPADVTGLYEKGAVDRSPAGRGFAYFPVADSHGLTARRMHRELDQDGERSLVLARFVEGLGPDDEAELRRLLEGGGQ
ncbi:BlaI/MecI/CopY family transcriptional regulator, partial [Streptomyces sp. NPDC048551]|uniref:BlaI/MecI/CopY family transcriptional regulator n=1 Tax=Streptomyces sp. NPDC048551 TaxID=3155758 RepID=UPI00341E65E2